MDIRVGVHDMLYTNGSTQGNSNSTMEVEPRFGVPEAGMLNHKPNSLVREKTHAHDTGLAQK